MTEPTLALGNKFTEIGTRGDKHGFEFIVTTTTPSPVFPVIFAPPAGFGIEAFPAILCPAVTPPIKPDPPPPPLPTAAPDPPP